MRHSIVLLLVCSCYPMVDLGHTADAAGGGSAGGAAGGSAGGTAGGAAGGSAGGAGGGTAGGSGGGAAVLTAASFCGAFAQAACARNVACGYVAAEQQPTCEARVRESWCGPYVPRADAGTLLFQPDVAETCLSGIAGTRCNEYPELSVDELCSSSRVFIAAGLTGAKCLAFDCVGGYCAGSGGLTCGACANYLSLNDACTPGFDGPCDPSSSFCGSGQCRLKLAPGTPCTSPEQCPSDKCVGAADGGRECGPNALGARCHQYDACAPTAYCRGLRYLGPGTCTARIPLGSPCVNESVVDDGCVTDAGPAECLGGRCIPLPDHALDAGSDCRGYGLECVDGYICDADQNLSLPDGGPNPHEGHCVPRLPAGAACMTDLQCDRTLSCSAPMDGGQRFECTARGPAGAHCTGPQYCKAFLFCSPAQTCRTFPDLGDACGDPGSTCLHGNCVQGQCTRVDVDGGC